MRWRALLSIAPIALALSALAGALSVQISEAVHAQTAPALVTNERLIEAVIAPSGGFALSDPKAVFAEVLARLPPQVKVYPTENYYYFSFVQGGVGYAGNIRLDVRDRDQGILHFAYFPERTSWTEPSRATQLTLDAAQGVTVEKVERLVYRVTGGASSVLFELNDLAGVRPPPAALLAGEQYLGPVFDESGVRFFLVFNPRARVFHYVLDETMPPADQLASGPADRILIGMRTGFAFYQDFRAARKLLIGVYAENAALNNYFDGPFDQLPDNFIEGDGLREAILAVEPRLSGKIGRLGHYRDGTRYLIAPYKLYWRIGDLAPIDRCAKRNAARAFAYAACFALRAVDPGQ